MEQITEMVNLAVIFIPIIIGVNSLLKKVGLEGRFLPVVNVLLGFMAFPLLINNGIYPAIIACLVIGLSAGGFYDLGKRTILNK